MNKNSEKKENPFECVICLETAKEPVVTKCGHLYCWPCIYEVVKIFLFSKVVRIQIKFC